MQRELVAVPEHWTVGDVIDYLRGHEELTTDFWEIFVVDPAHKPVGTCQLSLDPAHAARHRDRRRDEARADADPGRYGPGRGRAALPEICADLGRGGRSERAAGRHDHGRRHRPHHPEEAGEDILRLSGAGEGDINEPIRLTVRTRITWLVVNLGTAMLAASVVGAFQGEIGRFALLAVLMPIVSGMGGNAGTQTLAVAVRALATNQLTSSNTARMIAREFTHRGRQRGDAGRC